MNADWAPYGPLLKGIDLPANFFERAQMFLTVLAEANKKVNLVSRSLNLDLVSHAVDSVQVLSPGQMGTGGRSGTLSDISSVGRAIDVGTGGGFPGAMIALARPGWSVTLLDSLQKKCSAVNGIIGSVGLSNASVVCGRAEDLARDSSQRETYDVAFCRAVGRFSVSLELTLPLLKIGGVAMLHRGHDGLNDVSESVRAVESLGGVSGASWSYQLPGADFVRSIICVVKSTQTNIKFPRRAGMPEKRPL